MKIGLIIAMESEYRMLSEMLGGDSGRLGRNEIVLSRCGIGKVNAAVGTMRLIDEHRPECIISSGVAGGIDQSLEVMDIVVADKTIYHDVWCGDGNEKGQVQGLPPRFESDVRLCDAAMAGSAKNVKRVYVNRRSSAS